MMVVVFFFVSFFFIFFKTVHFCIFTEFIRESLHVYENLLISAHKTDNLNDSFEVTNQDSSNNHWVSSKALYENIELLCAKANYRLVYIGLRLSFFFFFRYFCFSLNFPFFSHRSTPPLAIIKELLNKEKTVQFYEFLNKLSKNESINNLIGRQNHAKQNII
jgi:hypothetical protein